jgi:hypothetical protein
MEDSFSGREEFAEGHDGRGKRSTVACGAKLKTAAQEMHVTFFRVIVPPAGIDASGKQAHHERTVQRFFPCLLHPSPDFAAVRRVHKNLAAPGCFRPSSSFVKYRAHLAFCGVAQGSRVNPPKIKERSSNRVCGVGHSGVALEKCTFKWHARPFLDVTPSFQRWLQRVRRAETARPCAWLADRVGKRRRCPCAQAQAGIGALWKETARLLQRKQKVLGF